MHAKNSTEKHNFMHQKINYNFCVSKAFKMLFSENNIKNNNNKKKKL